MKRIWIAAAALLIGWGTAAAQSKYQYEIGGMMLGNDAMSPGDLFSLSQVQFNFSTARSMGMGGAFTSLGADQASMSINPAGLGMYLENELAITPMLSLSRSSTEGVTPYQGNSRNRFALGNIGAVFNVYEGAGRLVSFNLGIGYNRLADYNYNYSFQYGGGDSSIADALAVQLESGNIGLNKDKVISQGGFTNWDIDPLYWNGVAAYKSYLLDRNDDGVWYPSEIGSNAVIDAGTSMRSTGSAGEFDISMGGNIGNKLYFGFTLGIQRIYQKKEYYYGEAYSYNGGNGYGYGYGTGDPAVYANGDQLSSVMQSMGMTQTSIVDGSGVNFKLGLTYRPFAGLRLGVAFHSPTYYSLDRRYQVAMSTVSLGPTDADKGDFRPHEYTSEQYSPEWRDENEYSWCFVTPSRLLFGASYTFGRFAVLSVDYERDWYNGIRMKDMPEQPAGLTIYDFKQNFKTFYKGSNTLRIGAEIRPLPMLAVRAGYGYNGSMLKDSNIILSSPVVYQTNYYTAGLGISFKRTYIDLAYCYAQNKMTPYMLFYGNRYDMDGVESDEIHTSGLYKTEINRHNVALTLGFRF